MKIAVIGAGITGVTTAYKLQDHGCEVAVFDKNPYAAMETSYANGGQLSASNAEVWNHWATIFKGLRWMLRKDAPLLMNPRPSWHKISWMVQFLANIPKAKENTIKTVEMAMRAREHLLDMAAQAGVEFDYSACGILHFYSDQDSLQHARRINGWLAQGGLQRREIDAAEIKHLEPNLRGDFLGGFFTPCDATGDIHKFTMGLAKAAQKRGAMLYFGHGVNTLHARQDGIYLQAGGQDYRFDRVVICAGVGSRKLARTLGDSVNIYPVKGYSITVMLQDQATQNGAPMRSLLDDKAKIVTSRLGKDRFRVAGTAEFNGLNRDIRADRIAPLTAWVRHHFPAVSTESVIPWAGLRPMMPSMLPRIGAGRRPNVFYNTGHGHLGWTLSAISADMIAKQVIASR